MATLIQRTTAPERSNPYYANNPYEIKMPNCTCYAYGRYWEAVESAGETFQGLPLGDAWQWYPNYGGSKGTTPKVGSILCHSKSGAAGHVAFVEEVVSSNEIIVTDSQYTDEYVSTSDTRYWRSRTRYNNDGNWGGAAGGYTFQGFIYSTVNFEDSSGGGDSGGGDSGGGDSGGGDSGGGDVIPPIDPPVDKNHIYVTIDGDMTVQLLGGRNGVVKETFGGIVTSYTFIDNGYSDLWLVIYPKVGYEKIYCQRDGNTQIFYDVERNGIYIDVEDSQHESNFYFKAMEYSASGNVYIENNNYHFEPYYCLIDTDGSGFEYYTPYISVENDNYLFTATIYSNSAYSLRLYEEKECTNQIANLGKQINVIVEDIAYVQMSNNKYITTVFKVSFGDSVGWVLCAPYYCYIRLNYSVYGIANKSYGSIISRDKLTITAITPKNSAFEGSMCTISEINGEAAATTIPAEYVDFLPSSGLVWEEITI